MPNTRSQLMANYIAQPRAMNLPGESQAIIRVQTCRVQTAAADAANHLYRLCVLDATDRIIDIRRNNVADAGMTTVDIGIYVPSTSTTDPVAVDADGLAADGSYAAAVVVTPGGTILGLGNTNAIDFGKALWEYAPGGPATQPPAGTKYEIVMSPGGDPVGVADYTILILYLSGA